MRRRAVTVLTYHEVRPHLGGRLRSFGVHPEAFARQMALLAKAGWRTCDLDHLGDALRGVRELPRGAFVLTFDDGYAELERYVAPILARHGFRAIAYVVTDRLGAIAAWDDEVPRLALFSPDAIRRLDGGVFRFESHSRTHPVLTRLDPDGVRREVAESRHRLEDVVGREVTSFAYPYGAFDVAVEAIVRDAGYRTAATMLAGPNRPGDDPLRIRRVTIRARDMLAGMLFKVMTGHGLRSAARRMLGHETGRASRGPR